MDTPITAADVGTICIGPTHLAALRLRQPLVPWRDCEVPGGENAGWRWQAVESAFNLAVRQCLLEFLQAVVCDFRATKPQ